MMGSPSPTRTPTRKPLHERTESETNASTLAAVRLVPPTPPRLLGGTHGGDGSSINPSAGGIGERILNVSAVAAGRDEMYSRTPLPTHPSHVLSPGTSRPAPPPGFALTQSSAASGAVSALQPPAKQRSPPPSPLSYPDHHNAPIFSSTTSPTLSPTLGPSLSRPLSKRRKHVKVNPDKTFSVLDLEQPEEGPSSSDDGLKSPSSRASQLSHDQQSSDTQEIVGDAASPTSFPPGSSAATTPTTPAVKSPPPITPGDITASPWNYRLVGGLRKVPKTPDLKGKAAAISNDPVPELPRPTEELKATHELASKPSFHSNLSSSTTSGETNYKVYGTSPTPILPPPSAPPSSSHSDYHAQQSSHASESDSIPNYEVFGTSPGSNLPSLPPPSSPPNYEILGQTSPISQNDQESINAPTSPSESNYQILGQSSPAISDIDLPLSNYELHGDPSPTASSVALARPVRATYSRESLIVPPLQPRAQRSFERFGYYKSRSRESLRSASLTSLSTVLSQEAAQAIVATGALIHVSRSPSPGSWVDPLVLNRVRSHMQAHPHQWSSQLSTVPSVSEGGTDRGSRSLSDNSNPRRSSGFPSTYSRHSRQMASISSSLEEGHSDGEILERPQPVYTRSGFRDVTGSTIRMVEDQDEHGDGITDMPDLRQRTSRNRLSGFFSSASSDNGRSDTMRSNSSSRANSLLSNGIPTWARLYYGSGERRFLISQPSIEAFEVRPKGSFREGSPDEAAYPANIYHPRKRPRENNPNTRRTSGHGSMDINEASPAPVVHGSFTRRFRRPSSVWSPHLHRQDRRAVRSSIWEPPSVNFSTDSGFFGLRNIQVVMFIVGFIFPFAWMIAAFLPLPPNPVFVMRERNHSDLDISSDIARQMNPMDEARYESARWWRNLNRCMAVVGIVIVILLIVLVLIGTRHQWAS